MSLDVTQRKETQKVKLRKIFETLKVSPSNVHERLGRLWIRRFIQYHLRGCPSIDTEYLQLKILKSKLVKSAGEVI